MRFKGKYQQYRHAIKSIREREEKLSDQREKKRSLQSRIQNLSKSSPRSPKLTEFQRELKSLAQDTHESEMDLADFKRFALKEAFYLRFNAMNDYAQKTALIAGFGKYLTDLIEIEPTPPTQTHRNPYEKGPEAAIIFADAMNALENWKSSAEDERPTLANNPQNTKGKEPDTTPQVPNTPPQLPPRRPTQDGPTETAISTQPSGYTTGEVSSATGDLKTNIENEIDIERIDLYDAPPPAYDGPSQNVMSSPLNSDAHLAPNQGAYEHQYNNASFNSPYQVHAHLPAQKPYSPHPNHVNLTDSPAHIHAYPPQQTQQHHHWAHQDSSFYDPTNMMYSQVNYQQLYRQVSQRQQYCAPHRPYSEFQQQFNHGQQNIQGQQLRQKVDAGGFRIPPNQGQSAEEEKERLAQHYRHQDQQYYDDGSQYHQKPATPPAPVPAHAHISQQQEEDDEKTQEE
ncbi:Eisosome component PIL1-domain-containing protein [Gilbertella persicaria]|uniref:Eisosome component PIL1-domain-containing protein n=1 Tax=Gilbertella persicaria TaxID=101096 RepID=UPI00221FC7CA|nr:Eisosome component PIL1-domain-containing protein [Gilbertella persicaria]KAI8086893.1 Eisosome component PIL1-domain-containing protein [Gilbertella persicaria]